jgi:hypothetical protein
MNHGTRGSRRRQRRAGPLHGYPAAWPWTHDGRTRTGLCVLACCCAALAACTAAPPKGPDTAVTTPAVGRPPAPASVQAALSSEAFTPYAGLSVITGDGLAPGETIAALHTACMDDAGYGQYANNTPYAVITLDEAFWGPYAQWGYIGTAVAAQDGFDTPLSGGSGFSNPPGLPTGAQVASGKCANIVDDFDSGQFATSLAGIQTLNNAIVNDVAQDPDVKNATKAWSACMARNGYSAADPGTLPTAEVYALGLRFMGPNNPGTTSIPGLTPAQNKAQIATAVADADCTQAADLAGIYFAVQASDAQQIVTANQEALGAAVRQYKANYGQELSKLPTLLQTTSPRPARKVQT